MLTVLETGNKGVGLALAILSSLLDSVQNLLGLRLDLLQAILSNALGLVDILVKVLLGGDLADKSLEVSGNPVIKMSRPTSTSFWDPAGSSALSSSTNDLQSIFWTSPPAAFNFFSIFSMIRLASSPPTFLTSSMTPWRSLPCRLPRNPVTPPSCLAR